LGTPRLSGGEGFNTAAKDAISDGMLVILTLQDMTDPRSRAAPYANMGGAGAVS
jgi:hypothetical protein